MVTQEQQSIIDHAQLQKINGWQHIKVKGTPYECGFQEGYLLADEYKDALRVYKFMTLETFGMTYEWFAEQALKLHRDKIPTRWFEELRGMAEGLTAAGIPTTTDDMIAWNDWMEITGYWWPQNAGKIMSRPLMKTHRKEHCSAIVATGSATVDGKPYLGHESFDEFWSGQYFNICKRVEPDDGYAFIMQASAPCMLSSMTDFYVTAAGLNITETTLAGFDRYDDAGMPEWVRIRDAVQPEQIYLVVDAMTGQDVVNVAKAFAERVDFDAVIMSKMDGDARGGGALSIKQVTGKPIAYISAGEKPDSLENFHPDRMAKRILGMGDMASFIERAVATHDQEMKEEEAERVARGDLNLNDFITMNRQVHKMGGVAKMISALPGGDRALATGQVELDALDRMEVIIGSMTKEEREKPDLLNASRRKRIAAGAGTTVQEVNAMMKKYSETRKMVRKAFGGIAQMQQKKRPTKGKKKKKNGKRSRSGMPAGMSPRDMKKLRDMLGGMDIPE